MRVPSARALLTGLFALSIAVLGAGVTLRESRAQGAQEKPPPAEAGLSEYPYLPRRYGEAYIPSVADWQAVRLTALGASTTRLTDEFSRQHLTCFPGTKGLALTLDLLPEPSWKLYAGEGKFTAPPEKVKPALERAIAETVRFVRIFFSEVRDENLYLRLYIRSESVGVWEDGKLTLNTEKP